MESLLVQSMLAQTVHMRFNTHYLRIKRIMDIVFTLIIAPPLLIVGVIIAICIKLDSKGPIFFRQTRIGKNGVEFKMLKFRSMYVDSDESVHRKRVEAMMRNGQTLGKDEKDPRITSVGRFIRKTSLDELPQFWNVLVGDMTLVGPRPPLKYEVAMYSEHDWLRMAGRPGLTGTWQIYGRSVVTFPEMVNMDIQYLETQSIWQDVKFIFLTVPVMIHGRGAA